MVKKQSNQVEIKLNRIEDGKVMNLPLEKTQVVKIKKEQLTWIVILWFASFLHFCHVDVVNILTWVGIWDILSEENFWLYLFKLLIDKFNTVEKHISKVVVVHHFKLSKYTTQNELSTKDWKLRIN